MSRTYKATGINLKSMPLGEADRLVTILTKEFGLIRVVAPGARKQKSKLAGRMGLFVVNDLLLAKGRSLDKVTQAETLESYPGLSKHLTKLAASQYLAELVLYHALSEQPQGELFDLLNEHLRRIDELPHNSGTQLAISLVLAYLSHGIFHLLALAGIPPQVQICCLSQNPLKPDFTNPDWRVGFSIETGGIFSLAENQSRLQLAQTPVAAKGETVLQVNQIQERDGKSNPPIKCDRKLDALELTLFQELAAPQLPDLMPLLPNHPVAPDAIPSAWAKLERLLRDYAQYHFGKSIKSAALVDTLSIELAPDAPTHFLI
ncbi:MAG TPA: DNA repair protein RecO [Cyanobacteria bacterium UBA11149]|nr:DNA repair protein RecO [Cyanobacteria bacterium UBA11367]HBE58803.1 DNA repair protein RecO [Cyanobacteria bacterium UBA11366]HBK64391.1 DNA repair protein RecO [Cyanobacteria bacterium UBA11166]HBR73419.1 DNA repair protein RecO [Cyanobacteria bacterium UBA11159]HBW91740.1 DNA repair protein RecO [Cyanobacteria bacterium UBA11149]HCA97359.1 DNA repair protein RecO [Cyanobacteria bacterium UBA9226]